jgi:hypothetical protein
MKPFLKPFGLLFCAAIFSCSKQLEPTLNASSVIIPISDYTVARDPDDIFTFKFTSQAKEYSKLEWRFGDDTLKTEENPTHTYLDTGDPAKKFTYTADLKTISSTDNVSHKYIDLAIMPDSVVQMTADKTTIPNTLKFKVTARAPIASVLWTFVDQGLFGATGPTTKSSLASPDKAYVVNSVNSVAVKITTTKGSTATISRTVTPNGISENVTALRLGYTTNHENTSNTNENSPKLLDGNSTGTKFLMGTTLPFSYPYICVLTYSSPIIVKMYAVGNCGDIPKRDPKSWTVEGSNDGVNWTILDTQAMTQTFYDQQTALGATTDAQRYWKLFYFSIANPQAFLQYRWKITANFGEAKMQVSEFQLFR